MTSQETIHRKTKRVKFNSANIIPSKLTNINEVFNDVRSDKYIMKVYRAMRRRNNVMSGVEKLVETGKGRVLVRVNLGYRVAVGGGLNTWPAVVQVGPWIGPELDDPEKLVEIGKGRVLVRVNLGYRVAVGGGLNTWPAVVQVRPWIGPELDDPGSKGGSISF
ncbi:hypothetical protein Tco_0588196 [Tanacetum coccineum]